MDNKNQDTQSKPSEVSQPAQELTLPAAEESQQDTAEKDKKIPKVAIYTLASIVLLVLGVFGFWFCQKQLTKKPKPISFPTMAPTTTLDITVDMSKRCQLKPNPGTCKAYMPRYYFNESEDSCKEFIWGGCEGLVPFETLKECIEACEKGVSFSERLFYLKRYDLFDKSGGKFVKRIIKFSFPKGLSYIKEAKSFVDPLLDSQPPEEYSYLEVSTKTEGCILNTRGGFRIPEGEGWELVFKQKLGKIDYIMESADKKGNISGTIIDSSGLKITISFGVSWEESGLMESCIADSKNTISLLEYEILE